MSLLRLITAFALGAFFIYSGALKASGLDQFATNIAQYQILPAFLCKPAAFLFAFLELVAGICVFIPGTRRHAALLILCLMGAFLFALLSALARGLNINCGCLNSGSASTNLWPSVWKDMGLAAVAAFLAWSKRKRSERFH